MATIRNNLKEILESRGIKQKWLAEKAEVNERTLSNCITERHDISLLNALKIADALNMKVEDIFKLTKEEVDEIVNGKM